MKIRYTKTVISKEEMEVPDEYTYDDSLRGRVTDEILKVLYHNPEKLRHQLYNDDAALIDVTVNELKRAYERADVIMALLKAESGYGGQNQQT